MRKDVTDGELAVDEALRRGAGEVLLAGATGALDHTLGHLAILRRQAARGVAARLVAPGLSVTVLIAPASVRLAAAAGVRVSLVPLGGDATVTLTGLDYPLDRGVLPADACLGIGNHVAAEGDAAIVVHEGVVAALVETDDEIVRADVPAHDGLAALAAGGRDLGGRHLREWGGAHTEHGDRRLRRPRHGVHDGRALRRLRGAGLPAGGRALGLDTGCAGSW